MYDNYHCLFNTMIVWSFKGCLEAEQLEQWYAYRRYFFALFPSCMTCTSHLPRFHLCWPKICKKVMPALQATKLSKLNPWVRGGGGGRMELAGFTSREFDTWVLPWGSEI